MFKPDSCLTLGRLSSRNTSEPTTDRRGILSDERCVLSHSPDSPGVSLGKSTLLNALTEADVVAHDVLFATLDPTTRRLSLPSGREVKDLSPRNLQGVSKGS